jgi:hypothetical protein
MRIAIIGKGNVGSVLGARLASVGHDLVFASRTPASEENTLSHAEAVQGAELVITAIPGAAVIPTLEAIGEDVLSDRIVLDVSVPLTEDMKLAFPNESAAQRTQYRFPQARIVKSLNTMNVSGMIDPLSSLPQATIFVSGDDDDAKATVAGVLGDLGWPSEAILDLGGIETAIGTEHAFYLFFATYSALKTPAFNISIAR